MNALLTTCLPKSREGNETESASSGSSSADPKVVMWLCSLWVITRVFGVLALHGFPPYEHAFPSDGDVSLYWQWAEHIWHGMIPYRDFQVVYPPGAFAALALSPHSLALYRIEFLVLALGVDACVTTLLIRTGRPTGVVLWIVAAPLLGPIFWSRLDILLAGLLIGAVVAFDRKRYGWAGTFIAFAAALKIWPIILLPLVLPSVPEGRRQKLVLTTAAVAAVCFGPLIVLGGWSGIWNVFHFQSGRGVEFESIFAMPLYAIGAAGHPAHLGVGGALQFSGPANDVLSAVSLAALVVAVTLCCGLAFARRRQPVPLATWLLLVVAVLAITEKVLSAQYGVWIALASALFVDQARDRRRLFLITCILVFTTQVQFPLEYYQLRFGTKIAFPVSLTHAVVVVTFSFIAIAEVMASFRRDEVA